MASERGNHISRPAEYEFVLRNSLAFLSGLLALWLVGTASAPSGLDPTRDKILYVVATAHLDDQWNWTIQDTINNFIPNTLHQNFAFFANPNYTNHVHTHHTRLWE